MKYYKINKTKCLICGTGVGVRTHLPALKNYIEDKNIGLITRRINSAKKVTKLSLGYYDNDISKALEVWLPQIVIVGWPPELHEYVAKKLKDFDGIIIFEKPVGINFVQCEKIARILKNKKIVVNFQLRGLPIIKKIKSIIKEGRLGHIYNVHIVERSSTYIDTIDKKWYFNSKKGGGQEFSMLTHLIDLTQFVLPSRRIKSLSKNSIGSSKITPHTSAISFEFGTTLVQISTSSYAFGSRYISLEILGEKGKILLSFSDGVGKCELLSNKTRKTLWAFENKEKSLFRVAMPYYLKDILNNFGIIPDKTDPIKREQNIATFKNVKSVHQTLNNC